VSELTTTAAGFADASITLQQLRAIAPHAPDACLDPLNAAMHEAGITTPLRQAAFIAQLALECAEFREFEEEWGPTADQVRYEHSARLGNTQPGDGYRYRGRGGIQLTGRANYRACGAALGLDLESHPELAAAPEHRYRVSCWYWDAHKLSPLADDGDFIAITRAINGIGMYALRQRQAYYALALKALGAVAVCSPPAAS
jgi:putative chitinase